MDGSREANAPPPAEDVLGQDPEDASDEDADGWPDTVPGALRPGQFQDTVGELIRDDPRYTLSVSLGTSPASDGSGDRVQHAFAVVSGDEGARLEEARARLDAVGRDLADHLGTELLEAQVRQRRSDRPHQDP